MIWFWRAASNCSKKEAIMFLSRQRLPVYEWLPREPCQFANRRDCLQLYAPDHPI